jgi:hypothetical protein
MARPGWRDPLVSGARRAVARLLGMERRGDYGLGRDQRPLGGRLVEHDGGGVEPPEPWRRDAAHRAMRLSADLMPRRAGWAAPTAYDGKFHA